MAAYCSGAESCYVKTPDKMHGIRNMAPLRLVITRTVMTWYLLAILWRGYSHLLPGQLYEPAIFKVHYDLLFWFIKLSGIGPVLAQNVPGTIFSVALIALCLGAIIAPRRQMLVVLFSVAFLVLAAVFNIYLCHSAHYLGGMAILTVAFWPHKDENFEMLWDGMRYYACWIYGSAFLWKVAAGSFMQWDAGTLTFKSNLAEYIYHNPGTSLSTMYYYFLQHPWMLNLGHKLVYLAEGAFLIGFFTRKYDVLLICLAFFIFFSIFTFSDVFFVELLIVIFPLLPCSAWEWLQRKAPLLGRGHTRGAAQHQP